MDDERLDQLLRSHGQRWRDAHPVAPELAPAQGGRGSRRVRGWVTVGAAAAVAACVISALALAGTFQSDSTGSANDPVKDDGPRSIVISLQVISPTLERTLGVQLLDPEGKPVTLRPDLLPTDRADDPNLMAILSTAFWTAKNLVPGSYTVQVGTGLCNSENGCLSPEPERIYCAEKVRIGPATRAMARLVSASGEELCNIRSYGAETDRPASGETGTVVIRPLSNDYGEERSKDLRLTGPDGSTVQLTPDTRAGASGVFVEFWVAGQLKPGTYVLEAGPIAGYNRPDVNGGQSYGRGLRMQSCRSEITVAASVVERVVVEPTLDEDCAIRSFDR